MKVAVIGSGISGLAATWYLRQHHEVTLFEKAPSIGMDLNSLEVDCGDSSVYINAPMRVFFEGYYPTLSQLYRDIGIEYEPINYSGSLSDRGKRAYFHYKNHWLGTFTLPMLSGRSKRSFNAWQLGFELLRFLKRPDDQQPLSDLLTFEHYLDQAGCSKRLAERFLYPAFAGICTCSYDSVKNYPASILLEYLRSDLTWSRVNRLTHGVQDVTNKLSATAAAIRCNTYLRSIKTNPDGVELSDGNNPEMFDHVVIATQANHALQLLPEEMQSEKTLLKRIEYQQSRLIVHRDSNLAPSHVEDWAPVNFLLDPSEDKPMASIWMNAVYPQLDQNDHLFETWNPIGEVDPDKVLIEAMVERPVVTTDSLEAVVELEQAQQSERRVWLCGSYAHRGIPLLESAVASAKTIADRLAPS